MKKKDKNFLFGAVVGSGLTAQAADKAGADYLLALNAGRLRVQGASSSASFLPVRSANNWVIEFAEREMLGRCKAPLYAGLSVSDPNLDIDKLVDRVKLLGFTGVCNFPSTTSIDGRLGALFEREGLGFDRELYLIESAQQAGLKTFVYVRTNTQAREMVKTGADAICVDIGFTGGATGVTTHLTLESAAAQINRVLEGVPSSVNKLCHGGPITSPEQALAITRICGVEGFVAGSTLDRIPLEQTLNEVTRGFTAIPSLSRINTETNIQGASLVGSSQAIQVIQRDIEALAHEGIPILITGETGTGKSLVARRLHENGPNAKRQPVVVDCPVLDSEYGAVQLLGLGSGTRTGASSRKGTLETASDNTIIFEEINALTQEHQGKILKFVDEGVVQRIGEHISRSVSARVISTTSADLEQLLSPDVIRTDLYHRISAQTISIPPLRERVEDIPELVLHIGTALRAGESPTLSNAALRLLMEYDWPGNIRELRFALMRVLREKNTGVIGEQSFVFLHSMSRSSKQTIEPKKNVPIASEREWIADALARNNFRRSRTAQELGMTTRTLYNKIKKHGLQT